MQTPVYLLPGTMCNERLWQAVFALLPEQIEVRPLAIPQNLNFEQLAAHLVALLPHGKVNLLGFSLGGYIASYLARCFPERIARLFVIGNSPTRLPEGEINQRLAITKYVEQHGYSGMSRQRAISLLDGASVNESLVQLILQMDSELGADNFISQYRHTSQRIDLSTDLASLSTPVHFYYSEQDVLVDVSWLQQLAEKSEHIRLLPTEGSGHMLPLEKPGELAQHLLAWLDA